MSADVIGWRPAADTRWDELGCEWTHDAYHDAWDCAERGIYGMALDTAHAEYGLRTADEIKW